MERQPPDRQVELPFTREQQLQLIDAATKRLKADQCWTNTQIRKARDLMTAIVVAVRDEGTDAINMAKLAAHAGMSVRTVPSAIAFCELLSLIDVKRSTGPRAPHEYSVNFDTLRSIEAGRPTRPISSEPTEKPAERSAKVAERSATFADRSAGSTAERSEEFAERSEEFAERSAGFTAERSATFDDGARETYRHEHAHEHVIHNRTGMSAHDPLGSAPSLEAPTVRTSEEEAAFERECLARIIAKRKEAAVRKSTAPRDPPSTKTILRRHTRAESSSDDSSERTDSNDPIAFARELSLIINDQATDYRMFEDIARHVGAGRIHRDRVLAEAKKIGDPKRKPPLTARGAVFRCWFEDQFPIEFEPWNFANRRPARQASEYG